MKKLIYSSKNYSGKFVELTCRKELIDIKRNEYLKYEGIR